MVLYSGRFLDDIIGRVSDTVSKGFHHPTQAGITYMHMCMTESLSRLSSTAKDSELQQQLSHTSIMTLVLVG